MALQNIFCRSCLIYHLHLMTVCLLASLFFSPTSSIYTAFPWSDWESTRFYKRKNMMWIRSRRRWKTIKERKMWQVCVLHSKVQVLFLHIDIFLDFHSCTLSHSVSLPPTCRSPYFPSFFSAFFPPLQTRCSYMCLKLFLLAPQLKKSQNGYTSILLLCNNTRFHHGGFYEEIYFILSLYDF